MESITMTRIFRPLKTKGMVIGWPDPHSTTRHFVLLKYLQVLALPLKNGPMLGICALASLYTTFLLNSPRVSRKASSVLLRQLAGADIMLLLYWGLRLALGVPEEALGGLERGLLGSHSLANLLLLGCVSLEALLVCRKPTETRRLRTVHCARLASATVWAAVCLEFVILQASEYHFTLRDQSAFITLITLACTLLAPFIKVASFCARLMLWLANTWTFYTIFWNKPERRKSCFH